MSVDGPENVDNFSPEPITTFEELQLQEATLFPRSLEADLARPQLVGAATGLLERELASVRPSVFRRIFVDPYQRSRETMALVLGQISDELRLHRDLSPLHANKLANGNIQIIDTVERVGETLSPQNIHLTRVLVLRGILRKIFSSNTREEEIRAYHQKFTQIDPIISGKVDTDIKKGPLAITRSMSEQFKGIRGLVERARMREKSDPFLDQRVSSLVLQHKNGVFLDLGSGPGLEVSTALAAGSSKVLAIDNSEFAMQKAKAAGIAARKKGLSGTVEANRLNLLSDKLPVGDGDVDGAWCLNVIDAIGSPKEIHEFFSKVRDSLKPGGEFLIVTEAQPIFVMTNDGHLVQFSLDRSLLGNGESYDLVDTNSLAKRLGFTEERLNSIETTFELAELVSEAINRGDSDLREIISYGQTGEEVKAMLALAGFEIAYYEDNLETSSFKYTRETDISRGKQVCIVARKR